MKHAGQSRMIIVFDIVINVITNNTNLEVFGNTGTFLCSSLHPR